MPVSQTTLIAPMLFYLITLMCLFRSNTLGMWAFLLLFFLTASAWPPVTENNPGVEGGEGGQGGWAAPIEYFMPHAGEAIFLPANEPHAYISGDCVVLYMKLTARVIHGSFVRHLVGYRSDMLVWIMFIRDVYHSDCMKFIGHLRLKMQPQ